MANYSFTDPTEFFNDGAVITQGNFSQLYPDTPIMVGKRLTIKSGNFVNCRKDPNWIIEGGNFVQISRCSHVNPEFVARGLTECVLDCVHKTGEDTIQVAGVTVETVRRYEDTVIGK
jgi:hypothetical protein